MKLFIVFSALLALASTELRDATESLIAGRNDLQESPPTEVETTGSDLPEFFRIENIPEGYEDSTHQVLYVDGMRIEVNETVTKGTEEGEKGSLQAQIFIKVKPVGEGDPVSKDVSGELPSDIKSRGRRELIEYITKVSGNANCRNGGAQTTTPEIKAPSHTYPASSPLFASPLHVSRRPDLSYIGDTNVNYLGVQPKESTDAEIFDINLVRADAERFHASRPQTAPYSYPPQPAGSQPIRSQPIRSQPIRPYAHWSQPIRSQPIRGHQPVYAHPIRSQPLRSQPIQARPIYSQPLRSQPIQSRPVYSETLRTRTAHAQAVKPRL